jgi:prepilin-type N-terminal cleavage/methylation domain-containing protein
MKIQRGFTLVELAVATSIIVTLLGFITISLVNSQQKASLTSVEEVLLSNLREQQLKSMVGDTEGREEADVYGIHFDSDQYVLFHGAEYSPENNSNLLISLESNMQFNDPNFNVVFSRLDGEIPAATTINLQDKTNSKLKRIHINTLGVVTQVESL